MKWTAAERKAASTYIDLHFSACFPVSPSLRRKKRCPSPASGSGSTGGKAGEAKLSLCHLLLAGSPRKAALGMGGAHYVAEFSAGSHWAAAGDVQDTQTALQGLPALLWAENTGLHQDLEGFLQQFLFLVVLGFFWFCSCFWSFLCFLYSFFNFKAVWGLIDFSPVSKKLNRTPLWL